MSGSPASCVAASKCIINNLPSVMPHRFAYQRLLWLWATTNSSGLSANRNQRPASISSRATDLKGFFKQKQSRRQVGVGEGTLINSRKRRQGARADVFMLLPGIILAFRAEEAQAVLATRDRIPQQCIGGYACVHRGTLYNLE